MNSSERSRLQRERQHSALREALSRFAVVADSNDSLARRTRLRLRQWELLRQQNLEAVTAEALSYVTDGSGSAPDADWLAQFLELAADIHAPPLQSLWARILVAEVNRPGSFTAKALVRLRQFTERDASLLRAALALRCRIGDSHGLQILQGWGTPLPWWQVLTSKNADTSLSLARFGLPPSAVLALEELGLLYTEEFAAGPFGPEDEIPLVITNQRWQLVPRRPATRLSYLRFTPVGEELAQLLTSPPHSGYVAALREALVAAFELRDSND